MQSNWHIRVLVSLFSSDRGLDFCLAWQGRYQSGYSRIERCGRSFTGVKAVSLALQGLASAWQVNTIWSIRRNSVLVIKVIIDHYAAGPGRPSSVPHIVS